MGCNGRLVTRQERNAKGQQRDTVRAQPLAPIRRKCGTTELPEAQVLITALKQSQAEFLQKEQQVKSGSASSELGFRGAALELPL